MDSSTRCCFYLPDTSWPGCFSGGEVLFLPTFSLSQVIKNSTGASHVQLWTRSDLGPHQYILELRYGPASAVAARERIERLVDAAWDRSESLAVTTRGYGE